jgi:hypothetical protein
MSNLTGIRWEIQEMPDHVGIHWEMCTKCPIVEGSVRKCTSKGYAQRLPATIGTFIKGIGDLTGILKIKWRRLGSAQIIMEFL